MRAVVEFPLISQENPPGKFLEENWNLNWKSV
jgi:hypothetical protein